MDLATEGCIFFVINIFGFYIAYLYGRKTKRFRWSEYVALFIFPFSTVLVIAYLNGPRIIAFFLISAFVGFTLEYILGLSYEKTLNSRLWEYKRYSIGGYTSMLTLPFWGVAGVVFWFLAKVVGL